MNVKAATLLVLLLAAPAHAASVGKSRQVEIALLSEAEWVRPGHAFRVGIRMKIAPGWHTYWKNPGDAGLPLRLDVDPARGIFRRAHPVAGARSHPGAAVDELRVRGRGLVPGGDHAGAFRGRGKRCVTLAVQADWLECKEACLPGKADLDLAFR